MPTLELLSKQSEVAELDNNPTNGFQSVFFEDFDNVMESLRLGDNNLDPEDTDQITSQLLRTGPCPGTARVYYNLTEDGTHPSATETVNEFLGEQLNEELNRQELGTKFESWIDEGNEAVNRWLEDQNRNHITDLDIPEPIREFYLSRLDDIQELANKYEIELSKLKMAIDRNYSTAFLNPIDPDGAWLLENVQGWAGGVFESKLSELPPIIDKHYLTGYAVYIEREERLPVEIGVYLYTDDENDEICLNSFYINENFRSEIRENLTKFATLVQRSKEEGEWEGDRLTDRLVEPPEPEFGSYCENCLHKEVCHDE